jgi:uncharacterized membrane protein YgcG
MSHLSLILLPSMLVLVSPGWAAGGAKAAPTRPLNLSLPHDVLHPPGDHQVDETVERNLRARAPAQGTRAPSHPAALPYGAGYEHRHQGTGGQEARTGGSASPGSGGGGGGGAGRQGR